MTLSELIEALQTAQEETREDLEVRSDAIFGDSPIYAVRVRHLADGMKAQIHLLTYRKAEQ